MRRILILSGEILLIASFLLLVSVSGYLQTAHAFARAGHDTIVICSQDGVRTVTLDRDGNPTDPLGAICGHCPDCVTVSVFDIPVGTTIIPSAHPDHLFLSVSADIILTSRQIRKLPRGPPDTAMV